MSYQHEMMGMGGHEYMMGDPSEDAQHAAQYGRGGDTTLGHLTPGDVVIPRDVVMENPEFLVKLKKAMADMGGDYKTHVVGSGYESINPDTGAPEFGFGSFFKSVLPFIGGAVGSVFGGPIGGMAGGALGSMFGGGGQKKESMPTPTINAPQFTPTRPSASTRPGTLGDLSNLDPMQERSALATRGSQGGGLGQDEQSYYLNLLQRNILDESGNVGSTESLLPVERQYLNQSGYATDTGMNFLKSVQSKI